MDSAEFVPSWLWWSSNWARFQGLGERERASIPGELSAQRRENTRCIRTSATSLMTEMSGQWGKGNWKQ